MKLGSQTNSLVNHMMSGGLQPTPEVGMGCTILHWTDRTACTIIEVSKSGKKVIVQEDKSTRADSNGMSDSQKYTYEPNPEGSKKEFRLTKYGWKQTGGGPGLGLGYRSSYHDYSF